MPTWRAVETAAPELAGRVQARFDSHIHKVLATLRADGSPRVSGTEAHFRDGALWFASMPGARKVRDLERDPRMALHSAPMDTDEAAAGDAKISGRVEEITDPAALASYSQTSAPEGADAPTEFHLFRVDVQEIVLTWVDEGRELLVVESWNETRGQDRTERT